MTHSFKVLELCCGFGSWSDALAELGCKCTGVDIRDLGYKHRFIKQDVYDFEPDEDYDIVIASPPCTEFSIAKYYAYGTQKEHEGLDIVQRVQYLIGKIKPKYWLMENVRHLSDFIGPPHDIVRYGRRKGYKEAYLWGNFPKLPMLDSQIQYRSDNFGNSDPRRALIPKPLAKAVARVMINGHT